MEIEIDEKEQKIKKTDVPKLCLMFFLGSIAGAFIMCVGIIIWAVSATSKPGEETADAAKQDDIAVKTDAMTQLLDEDLSDKLEALLACIKLYGYYEELESVDFSTGVYKGLIEALDDPYAEYYSPDEYKEFMEDSGGSFAGIGATLQKSLDTGTVTVINVFEGAPAEKAGVLAGDIVVSADGYEAADFGLDDFVAKVRGDAGTDVHLELYRNGETIELDVTRDIVETQSVAAEMLDDGIAYIEIVSFTDTTAGQLEKACEDMKAQGMKAIIFDVRLNGGGLLTSVVDILDYILPEGLLCYEEDFGGRRMDYYSEASCISDIPMVVLTSGYSASGAELFTGALKCYDYATVIGTTTFGKGIVQSVIPLNDGSAVKITTQKYFTPDGVCIHGVGVEPDVELDYEFTGTEDDEYAYEFDNQIQKAIEVLKEEMGQ